MVQQYSWLFLVYAAVFAPDGGRGVRCSWNLERPSVAVFQRFSSIVVFSSLERIADDSVDGTWL